MKTQQNETELILSAAGYSSLADVLQRAFIQASAGKGKERHANDLPFNKQPMQTIAGQFGIGFLLGQATKKSQESQSLPHDRAVAELLGAINYLAGAVIFMEAKRTATFDVKIEREHANDNNRQCNCTTVCAGNPVGSCKGFAAHV